jgi:hypothetical protein
MLRGNQGTSLLAGGNFGVNQCKDVSHAEKFTAYN